MTIEKYDSVWQVDHCLPKSSFNLLDENDIKKMFQLDQSQTKVF